MIKLDPGQIESAGLKKVLEYLISKHDSSTPAMLQDYYEGRHKILERTLDDKVKPNNKLIHNLASYISDTLVGYFTGKPVSYTIDVKEDDPEYTTKKEYIDAVREIYERNDEQDHNAELAKGQSVKAVGYELLYMDEEAMPRFTSLARENVIYVETDGVGSEPLLAVRIYTVDDVVTGEKHQYIVYTDSEIITFERQVDGKTLNEVSRETHPFGGVPVVAYPNNTELLGDFEGVISLIDAYNKAQSDTANDFEYFTDAYLVLVGAKLDDKAIAQMRQNRVIGLPDKEMDAKFLIKDLNDQAIENFKNRLRSDIHAMSKTPDLTDAQFGGNITGVAISYKLWGMEQIVSMKERKFKKALQRRLELITDILNLKGKSWDWRDINITFSRNMPQNIAEWAQIMSGMGGRLSNETLLAIFPLVEDPTAEMERIENEKETIDLDMIPEQREEQTPDDEMM